MAVATVVLAMDADLATGAMVMVALVMDADLAMDVAVAMADLASMVALADVFKHIV